MTRDLRSPLLRLLALLLALVLAATACGDDDDDDGGSASGSASASGSEVEDHEDDDEAAEEPEPLSPEEARAAGSPEVYERISTTEDCAELADEHEAHEANANGYFADDPERGPIFREYANATKARMAELNCPENAGETTTSTTAPAS